MDVEAVRAALSPQALAPPIARALGLRPDAVAAALGLLAEGAQPAFIACHRPDRVDGLGIAELERIQGAAARAAAFEFQRQQLRSELRERGWSSEALDEVVRAAEHALDLDDIRLLLRRRKRGPAAKARGAGLQPLADALLREGTAGPLADPIASGWRRSGGDRPGHTDEHDEAELEASADEPAEASADAAEPSEPLPSEPTLAEPPHDAAPLPSDPFALAGLRLSEAFPTADDALAGARTICAERIAEWPPLRIALRRRLAATAKLAAHVVADRREKAGRYVRFTERAESCAQIGHGHLLAISRGEREGLLTVELEADEAALLDEARTLLGIRDDAAGQQIALALQEAWHYALGKAVRTGVRRLLKERADSEAVAEYADALRPMLLAPAYGHRPVIGIDPGFQGGCRVVVVDGDGVVLEQDAIFPLQPRMQVPQARARLLELVIRHGAEAIAIADAGGGRELERHIRQWLREPTAPLVAPPHVAEERSRRRRKRKPDPTTESDPATAPESDPATAATAPEPDPAIAPEPDPADPASDPDRATESVPATESVTATVPVPDPQYAPDQFEPVVVALVDSEAAAVLAAARATKEELGEDPTLRRAAACARRLQDPLRELVKIDPRKLGLGQFQHEVDQEELRVALDQVVGGCVSLVGVDVTREGVDLLARIAGLSHALARALVTHREAHGPARTRSSLFDVPGMVGKSFEQCAGFLRIPGGEQPLDATAIHPERYPLVTQMARDVGVTVPDLLGNPEQCARIDGQRYLGSTSVAGEPLGPRALELVLAELRAPGRDVRPPFTSASFDPQLAAFADLQVGMELEGVVTRIANFGVFVDVGLPQEGLVHVSELSWGFVARPADATHVGAVVKGKVIEIDPERRRFSLSLRALQPRPPRPERERRDERRSEPPRDRERPEGERGRGGPGPGRGRGGDRREGPRDGDRPRDREGDRGDRRPGKGGKGGGPRRREDERPEKRERTLNFHLDLSALMDRVNKG